MPAVRRGCPSGRLYVLVSIRSLVSGGLMTVSTKPSKNAEWQQFLFPQVHPLWLHFAIPAVCSTPPTPFPPYPSLLYPFSQDLLPSLCIVFQMQPEMTARWENLLQHSQVFGLQWVLQDQKNHSRGHVNRAWCARKPASGSFASSALWPSLPTDENTGHESTHLGTFIPSF